MLTIYTLKSASEASKYYQKDNYYSKEGEEEYTQWLGKGAEILGLEGSVSLPVFKGLLEGRLPNGEVMIQTKQGLHHRPGYDLTFSAPKSVSILAIVGGDERVMNAHREAVREVLTQIEGEFAAFREKEKGVITIQKTGNMTFATFEHHDSRALDPNLHTHCILMNMTQRGDGAWRTIFGDHLYDYKLRNGMRYRAILAEKLLELGIAIVQTSGKGLFELEGFEQSLIDQFSKRRQQIKDKLTEMGLSGGKAAKIANFETRIAKVKIDPEHLELAWEYELKACGKSKSWLKAYSEESIARGPIPLKDPSLRALEAIHLAIPHLSSKKHVFQIQEIIQSAKELSILPGSDFDLLKAIETKIEKNELLYVGKRTLTIPEAHELEANNIAGMRMAKKSVNPISMSWVAGFIVSHKLTTDSQRAALRLMLTSEDRQLLISSYSTEMLEEVFQQFNLISRGKNYYTLGLTNNTNQVERLKEKLRFGRATTLSGFLKACEVRAEKSNQMISRFRKREAREIWVVNSPVSLVQVNRLQAWSEHFGARLIFAQTKNEANPALDLLSKEGIAHQTIHYLKTYEMTKTIRENLLSRFEQYGVKKCLHEISNNQERIQKGAKIAAQDILKSQLVTLTAMEQMISNDAVREHLKNILMLQGIEESFESLQPVFLSKTQKTLTHLYQMGDVLLFKKENKHMPIKEGDYLKIIEVDLKRDMLFLKSSESAIFQWQPTEQNKGDIEIFRQENKSIMQGDIICWTKTFKGKKRKWDKIKGERAVVENIEDKKITVLLQNGQKTILKTDEILEQHWDYAYTSLLNANTLIRENNILLISHEFLDQKATHYLNNFLKDGTKKIEIICDNIDFLKKRIETNVVQEPCQRIIKPYNKEEALKDTPALLTHFLFPNLQTNYFKVIDGDKEPEKSEINRVKMDETYAPEFRIACEKIDYICTKYQERDAVFSLKAVMDETFEFDGLNISEALIEAGFEKAIADGWLIVVQKEDLSQSSEQETWVTTKETIAMEKACITNMKQGKNAYAPIKDETELRGVLKLNQQLTQGQKEAIFLVLTTSDRVVGVQGVAGSGKTTMLKEVNRLCQSEGVRMIGLSNMASAKNRLREATHSIGEAGIESLTLAKFLIETEKYLIGESQLKASFKNALIVLDEASFASTHDLFSLQKVIEGLQARLLLLGDVKQMGAIQAGKPFYLLLGMGMANVAMTENVRFQNPNALSVMQDLYAQKVDDAFDKLSDSIVEIPRKDERLKMMVDLYLTRNQAEREKTLLITPLNEDRQLVNQMIRNELKNASILQGMELTTTILLRKEIREVEKREIYAYEAGNMIRFNMNNTRNGIKVGDYAKVINQDFEFHRLLLKLENNQTLYWSPKKEMRRNSIVEIYQVEQRNLMKGDHIIWKRNNEDSGIFNGDKAEVLNIHQTNVTVLLKDGTSIEMDLNKNINQHLDYAYAVTLPVAQGRDVPWTFGQGESPRATTIKTSELKVGDQIVLPKEDQKIEPDYHELSKVVIVKKIEKSVLTLQDRDQYIYEVDIAKRKNKSWDYYPPFEKRKARELPKSTSLNGILVEATRGDNFILVVDNLDYYCETVKAHHALKESATEYLTPHWKAVANKVDQMTATITGKANPNPLKVSSNLIQEAGEISNDTVWRHSWRFVERQKEDWVDKDELIQRLHQNILGYVTHWRGSPNKVTAREARWGKKGSFAVVLRGTQAGTWSDFESGERGKDLISLYRSIYGVSFKEALSILGRDYGLRSISKKDNSKNLGAKNDKASIERLEQDEKREKMNQARKIYEKGLSIQGTLAERYLRKHRGITGELPKDFRFIPGLKHPDTKELTAALIVPIREQNQAIIGIVRIFLDKEGDKLKGQILDAKGQKVEITSKANLGMVKGGAVYIQSGVLPGTLWVAEGVETALSVAKAKPAEAVVASLSVSQLKGIPVDPEIQKVVICADNDGSGSNTRKALLSAVEHHLSEGRRVFIAMPSGDQKCDFNDLLKKGGVETVDTVLAEKVEIKSVDALKVSEPKLDLVLQKIREESSQKVSILEAKKEPLIQNRSSSQMER